MLGQLILDALLPIACTNCGTVGSYLCPGCYNQLAFAPSRLQPKNITYLDSVQSALLYTSVTRKLIRGYKYQALKGLGKHFSQLIYNTCRIPQVDLITNVPCQFLNRRLRGFDQSQNIAQQLAKKINRPYQEVLYRNENSTSQTTLTTREERLQALENTFSVKPILSKQVKNSTVLIVDDVFTTGSSLETCAKLLKAKKYQSIHAITIAYNGS